MGWPDEISGGEHENEADRCIRAGGRVSRQKVNNEFKC